MALREINVQFQLENFKLQQKIKRLENRQFDDCFSNDDTEQKRGLSVTTLTDSTFDPTAEYLEDYELSKKSRKSPAKRASRSSAAKRNYAEAFVDDREEEIEAVIDGPSIIKEELIIEDKSKSDEDFIPDTAEKPEDEVLEEEIDSKAAAVIVYKLAAKYGVLDKLKTIESGKQKDSYFVNKTLELFFDREHLANSSVRGQQCQSKLHVPARPALDHKKLNLCRQAFVYRLKREGLSYIQREERLKLFYSYVNFKIQNSRKLLNKKNILINQ